MNLRRAAAVSELMPRPLRLRDVRPETPDTFTLELAPGDAFPAFFPGQFNMLYAFGVGDAAISISGDPHRGTVLAHTIRRVGAVTSALSRLGRDDFVGVRGPFGNGWPLAEAAGRDVVLVAGGIGIAPLRSLVYALVAERDLYGKIVLAYGARTPGDVLFRGELEHWKRSAGIDVVVTVDRATVAWRGRVGVVSTLLRQLAFDPGEAVAMLCGPEVMMRYAAHELLVRDVSPSDIHVALERNMKCGVGLCGHCQLGPALICRDGPVFSWEQAGPWLGTPEL